MPTYEYACTSCGHEWEAEQSIKDEPLKQCPSCEAMTAKRQISRGTGFILKGGGWYSDLYSGSSNSKGSSSSDSTSTSTSTSSTKSDSKGGGTSGSGSTGGGASSGGSGSAPAGGGSSGGSGTSAQPA